MELIELKNIWQYANSTEEKESIEEGFVLKTIHKESSTEVSKIKNVIFFKLIFGGLVGIMTLLFSILSIIIPEKVTFFNSIFSPLEYTIFFSSMALSIGVIVFYNYKVFRAITKFQTSSVDIKDSLIRVIRVLENAISINIYSDALITPVMITWLVYAKVFSEKELTLGLGILVLVVIPILTFCISYFFQRYTQKLKFGNYIDRLKSYLKTLEPTKDD